MRKASCFAIVGLGLFIQSAHAQTPACANPASIVSEDSGDLKLSPGSGENCMSSSVIVQSENTTIDLIELNTQVANNTGDVAGLEEDILTVVSQIVSQQSQITAVGSQLTDSNSNMSDVNTTVQALQAAISSAAATAQQTTASIGSMNTTMNRRYETMMQAMSTQMSQMSAVQACLDNGQLLHSNGTCIVANPHSCPTYPINTSRSEVVTTVMGTAYVGSEASVRCVRGVSYGPHLYARCEPPGNWVGNTTSACMPISLCQRGAYQRTAATETTNTVCRGCPSGYFQSRANFTGSSCTRASTCRAGQYSSGAPTNITNRVCRNCPSGQIQLANGFTGTSCLRTGQNQIWGTNCRASSQYHGGYRCSYALQSSREWATRHQGAGSWFRHDFSRPVYVNKLYFQQRGCGCEWYRRIQVRFYRSTNGGGGEVGRRTINLPRSRSSTQTFAWVGPVRSVYMYFDQQWSRVNNGAQQIWWRGFNAP